MTDYVFEVESVLKKVMAGRKTVSNT